MQAENKIRITRPKAEELLRYFRSVIESTTDCAYLPATLPCWFTVSGQVLSPSFHVMEALRRFVKLAKQVTETPGNGMAGLSNGITRLSSGMTRPIHGIVRLSKGMVRLSSGMKPSKLLRFVAFNCCGLLYKMLRIKYLCSDSSPPDEKTATFFEVFLIFINLK